MVALAVVTGIHGVLVGRRRDGIPRWVFSGGSVGSGESPAQAAVRECTWRRPGLWCMRSGRSVAVPT